MLFEPIEDSEPEYRPANTDQFGEVLSKEKGNDARQVCIYFLDEREAQNLAVEMKQLGKMSRADLRITATTLGKAIRNAAHIGDGMVTGQPIDKENGRLPVDSGVLRHKIVPSTQQIFYAARCDGCERIGLDSRDAPNEAFLALSPKGLKSRNAKRRTVIRRKITERSTISEEAQMLMTNSSELAAASLGPDGLSKINPLMQENIHMDGYTGIPVFGSPNLVRKQPLIKRFLTNSKQEIPLYFRYQDLLSALNVAAKKSKNPEEVANAPLEVHNFFDVLLSMERVHCAKELKKKNFLKNVIRTPGKTLRDLVSMKEPNPLDQIVFVPSSTGVKYMEYIRAKGNGKARLRPMRAMR